MNHSFLTTLMLFALVLTTFTAAEARPPKNSYLAKGTAQEENSKTEILYAKHGFYVERGRHITTNYGVQRCYPVNTKFEVTYGEKGFRQPMIVKDLSDGSTFEIENAEKYTHVDNDGIKARMFSPSKTSLAGHSPAVLNAIKNCRIINGMTKNEVILARGYPPAHQTPSLKGDYWNYWYKRTLHGTVHFKNDRVVEIGARVQMPQD